MLKLLALGGLLAFWSLLVWDALLWLADVMAVTTLVWQLQDRTGQLWWSRNRDALERHVAQINAGRPGPWPVQPRTFQSQFPYGYECPRSS